MRQGKAGHTQLTLLRQLLAMAAGHVTLRLRRVDLLGEQRLDLALLCCKLGRRLGSCFFGVELTLSCCCGRRSRSGSSCARCCCCCCAAVSLAARVTS
jgi:hypothetical protein